MISDIATVLAAELNRRLRSRPFLIGLFIGVLGIVALTKLPMLFESAFGGSNAVVLNGARVGSKALVAASSVVAFTPVVPFSNTTSQAIFSKKLLISLHFAH